jgi:hypothetical protein
MFPLFERKKTFFVGGKILDWWKQQGFFLANTIASG